MVRIWWPKNIFLDDFGVKSVYRLDETRFLFLRLSFYHSKTNTSQNETGSRLDDTRFLLLQSLFYHDKSNNSQNKTASRLNDTQIRLRRCAYRRGEKRTFPAKWQYYHENMRI